MPLLVTRIEDNNIHFTDYLVMFILISMSGIQYFHSFNQYLVIFFLIVLTVFIKEVKSFHIDAIKIVFLFTLLDFIQGMVGYFSIATFIATPLRLILAYMVVAVLKQKFITTYVSMIYIMTLFSLFIYFLHFIPNTIDFIINEITPIFIPFFDTSHLAINQQIHPNIILYTFNESCLVPPYRNSGPFWEPGAFSIFLMIGLILNTLKNKKLLEKRNVVFIIAIITTLSTSGIIALFIFLQGYYLSNKNRKLLNWLIIIILFFVFEYVYFNYEFMSKKVESNIETSEFNTGSRFGSALADIYILQKNPWLGYGRRQESKFGEGGRWTIDIHRNNGVTGLFVQMGLIMGLFYLFKFYKSLFIISKYYDYVGLFPGIFLSILVLGFSQTIFFKLLFIAILFLSITYLDKLDEINSKKIYL
ncbi:MAG: hypothetical protein AB9882_11245 [Ignavibacteriaceae bacterium]